MSGRPVSEIESGSFQGCNTIETITVPDTVVMVYEDSFTGASSLKKIISHTVGVEIQADSGVTIEYVNENNNQPTDETNPSEKADSSEPDNSSKKTATSKPLNPTEDTTPSYNNHGGNDEPGITVTSNPDFGNEDALEIGDYVYEETDEKIDTGSDNESSDTTVGQPEGIRIPDSDIVVTVDKNDNLVQVDSKGNKILLDSEKKYQMVKNSDGSVKIVDTDGKEVKVTEEGNVLFGDMDEEAENEAKKPVIIWVTVILGIGIVAVIAGLAVKKKMKKK